MLSSAACSLRLLGLRTLLHPQSSLQSRTSNGLVLISRSLANDPSPPSPSSSSSPLSAAAPEAAEAAVPAVADSDHRSLTYEFDSVESVLSAAKVPKVDNKRLILCLSEKLPEAAKYRQDPRFQTIIDKMATTEGIKSRTGVILSTLKAMDQLGVSAVSKAVQNLENELLWRARSEPMTSLVRILSFSYARRAKASSVCDGSNAGGMNAKVLKEVVRSLERRWVEIVEGQVFAGLLHYPDCFTEQFLNKIDDRITECSENLLASDLVLVINYPIYYFGT